jgi:dTDP-4-amino-4,6-dideoxygalactose transaminase
VIPLVDLRAQVASIRDEVDAAMRAVVDETAFILGPAVEKFEQEFARYIGVAHCVGVQSGTAALQLAMLALGIGPGDEVIVPPSSFFATAEAVSLTGARPVFVDVEPDTLNLDPARLEAALGPRTRAVIPVHLYGQSADLAPILALARARGVAVIEDACQAHGATYGEKRVGGLGAAGAFSFYPGKNLGAFGEGGAITTNDGELAARTRQLRDHGSPEKYRHVRVGFNYRLEGLQGAVLSVKLKRLDAWNDARRRLAARYSAALAGVGDLVLPVARDYGRPVYHLYSVRSRARERIFKSFADRGIARAIHYPIPIHLQEAYAGLGHAKGSFPITEEAAALSLSLPLYPELLPEQQDQVIDAVAAAFR